MDYKSDNIILRKAVYEDLKNIYKHIWTDLDILNNMFIKPCINIEEAIDRIQRTIEFQNNNEDTFFIALKSTNEAIGIAGIIKESDNSYKECGICIGKAYQHLGYGKEVLSLLLKIAFSKDDCNIFSYYIMKHNDISKRLALSFGFHYDIDMKEIRNYDNKEFILERYILTKEDYLKNN